MADSRWRSQASSILLRAIGLLLITSAGMKLWGIPTDPVAKNQFFREAWFGAALVQLELLLGVWFLVGVGRAGAWWSAIVLFGCFTLFSLMSAAGGRTTCGCFGKAEINPWYVVTLDVTIIGLLFFFRPSQPFRVWAEGRNRLLARPWRFGIRVGTLVCFVFVLGASLRYASASELVRSLRARVQGEPVAVVAEEVDLGRGEVGGRVTGWIELSNETDHPIRVVGAPPDCMLTATADLPIELGAGQSCRIEVMLLLPVAGRNTRKSVLYLNDRGVLRLVRFRASALAVAPASVPGESEGK